MYFVDQIPVGILHVLEADITEDTGVVDEDVNATKVLESCFYNGFTILHAVVVGCRLASSGFDFIDDSVGGLKGRVSPLHMRHVRATSNLHSHPTFDELPWPSWEPPKSFTTTLAPREAKNTA